MKQAGFSFWRVWGYGTVFAVSALSLMLFFARHSQFSSAHPLFCALATIVLPMLCLCLYCVFWHRKHRSGCGVVCFKTKMQITIERGLRYQRDQEVKHGVRNGNLSVSECSCKIKFPLVGFRNKTSMILLENEKAPSFLSGEEMPFWTFFDSNARLLQSGIVPPLTGWRKRIRRHFIGRWLIDVPEDGWIWFHLKHPVECHRTEMVERLVQYLSRSGVATETRELDKLIDLLATNAMCLLTKGL